jgi:Hexapeptide repeat of succinyl-transferase
MLRALKQGILAFWLIERFIRMHIRVCRALHFRFGPPGRILAALLDRVLLFLYGIDLDSSAIDVRMLSISHPGGILLGGNGLKSPGRVAIMGGAKLVARSPSDPEYLRRHAMREVFVFGDNVVIGANSVVVGPVDICDNVVIAALSLVNRSIAEPGVYAGSPVRRVKESVSDEWVEHLAVDASRDKKPD